MCNYIRVVNDNEVLCVLGVCVCVCVCVCMLPTHRDIVTLHIIQVERFLVVRRRAVVYELARLFSIEQPAPTPQVQVCVSLDPPTPPI